MTAPVYIALIHHPVLNKHGEVVTTSITNFDLHDLGRISKTYGVKKYFIVTPNEAQQRMARYIARYWREGTGSRMNPDRREAFADIEISSSLEQTCLTIQKCHDNSPTLIATTARPSKKAIRFDQLKELLQTSGNPHLILFGTGWGLAPEVMKKAKIVLEPIRGVTAYNHLPVRAAVAIVLDRILGRK
ncbi:MAG: RNA methyltransferase [Deltaproteobacteria bacterium]|nr:RNA methyltransferase [Deltaproteobacteria bacterium]